MPGYSVHPNISGNINSTVGPTGNNTETSANAVLGNQIPTGSTQNDTNPVATSTEPASSGAWIWIVGIVVVIAIASIALLRKKVKNP